MSPRPTPRVPAEPAARRGPRPHCRALPALEPLDGRLLLSHVHVPAHGLHAAVLDPNPPPPPPPPHGPLNEVIVGGHVSKHPQFYSEYTGPRLPELNGIGAQGMLKLGEGYTFRGRVLAPINPAHQAFYIFGINRGGAKQPPPSAMGGTIVIQGQGLVDIPRRQGIFVDTVVIVSVGPGGTAGVVQWLKNEKPVNTIPIPPQNIQISGRDVTVFLPPSVLPPNGLPADGYFYAFWTRSALGPASNIASFVPEYNITPIGVH